MTIGFGAIGVICIPKVVELLKERGVNFIVIGICIVGIIIILLHILLKLMNIFKLTYATICPLSNEKVNYTYIKKHCANCPNMKLRDYKWEGFE